MIAVVVPTNREEKLNDFLKAWEHVFSAHKVTLYVVKDGKEPVVHVRKYPDMRAMEYVSNTEGIMGKKYKDLIYNFNDGVRNLGFAAAYKDGAAYIISLDDDTEPLGDTIGDHINALNHKSTLNWINTTEEIYMRGFPYGVRKKAQVVLSHGGWQGVPDMDASTQLVLGIQEVKMRRMTIPQNVLFPMCIMNVGMRREAIPFMYQAPMFGDINRFADIWGGIEAKKDLDKLGLGVVTGYAMVKHERASDPFVNLIKEAKGIQMNENYGEGEYFELFFKQRALWQEFLKQYE